MSMTLIQACNPSGSGLAPTKLKGSIEDKGWGLLPPELSIRWNLRDSLLMGSYHLLVASEEEFLEHDLGNLWDSQRQYGTQTQSSCSAMAFPSTIWWKLRLWDTAGLAGPWSAPQKLALPESTGPQKWTLLGGSLVAGMEQDNALEKALYRLVPGQGLTIRNLGWAADDVFGLARSSFGSAQNTRSWQPPTAEQGFGSRVLYDQLIASDPRVLILGYGPEAAYFTTEEEWTLFTSGYQRLLKLADSLKLKTVILTPPRQEKMFIDGTILNERNQRLARVREWLLEMAKEQNYHYVDLFSDLITEPDSSHYTIDGVQLNQAGYERMARLILNTLGLTLADKFDMKLDSSGLITGLDHALVIDWQRTIRGLKLFLTNHSLGARGAIDAPVPVAIYVDGQLITKGQGPFNLTIPDDSIKNTLIAEKIILKNRMYRYRMRPLNEAYIYLFRRHEMGHLAYEMDHFQGLAKEYENDLARLTKPTAHEVSIEFIQPWQPPKNYVEDEVPAFIPEPNIQEELQAFNLPPGFGINLFASDPMIANPININWDTRGRAWVATSSTYPHPVPGREPNDKIVILEDTNADGVADKHTVFAEGLLIPHSVMPVPGGAYVTATTELLFLADTNGDDIADRKEVIYDGFGNADVHHTIHGLRWAPWGDLHFTQSIYINSFIETAYGPKRLNGSGIWSFRPETGRLDIYSRGLINPWGEAWDRWGQTFATDGAGSSGINYVYPESAHSTAVGAERVVSGLNAGTPKNIGAEVVYSRLMPASWQGTIITADFRANRTVRYALEPKGSAYTSQEVETIVTSDHRSYRPVDMKIGPDGALYIVDWYNPIIDHGEVDFHHPVRDKSHGRIWRMKPQNKSALPIPRIHGAPIEALLELLKSPEQFTRLQANRELVAQKCSPQYIQQWVKQLNPKSPDYDQHRLEALWLGAALGYQDLELLNALLNAKRPEVRAAAVRMIGQWGRGDSYMTRLQELVRDPHAQVRLEALHVLRSVGSLTAMETAVQVMESPLDENLEFALWQTARALRSVWLPALSSGQTTFNGNINQQMFALLACEEQTAIQLISQKISASGLADTLMKQAWQKMARWGDEQVLDQVLAEALRIKSPGLLQAMNQAPQSNKAKPTQKNNLLTLLQADSSAVRLAAIPLAGRWGLKEAIPQLGDIAKNSALKLNERVEASRALIKLDDLKTISTLSRSTGNDAVSATATAAWLEHDLTAAMPQTMALFQRLDSTELIELLFATFRRQEHGAETLVQALDKVKLSEKVASTGLRVTQTSGLNLSKLEDALRKAGSLTAIGTAMTQEEKQRLIEEARSSGNTSRGWAIFRRPQLLCAACHRVRDIGGLIGPDLSTVGTFMTPAAILEAIIQPNADIKQNYETYIVTKTSGEVITGTLHRKTATAILLKQTNGDILTIPLGEVAKQDISAQSLMPAGLTASLHRDELRDLLAFMMNLGVKK